MGRQAKAERKVGEFVHDVHAQKSPASMPVFRKTVLQKKPHEKFAELCIGGRGTRRGVLVVG
jgi:hypothetical protein